MFSRLRKTSEKNDTAFHLLQVSFMPGLVEGTKFSYLFPFPPAA